MPAAYSSKILVLRYEIESLIIFMVDSPLAIMPNQLQRYKTH
jgi:hypothetical protein